MKKELKDYLPYYLGCEVRYYYARHIELESRLIKLSELNITHILTKEKVSDIQLRLRTLSSLTNEERQSIGIGFLAKIRNAEAGLRGYKDMQYFPEEVIELLKLGVDIFGLIEDGLAIKI